MPIDPRRLSIALAVVALAATAAFTARYWALPSIAASPEWIRHSSRVVSHGALPVVTAASVVGAILVQRQRWWFAAVAGVAAVLAWAWLVDTGAGEANEYLGVILAFFLTPPLIVLEIVILARSVNAKREPATRALGT